MVWSNLDDSESSSAFRDKLESETYKRLKTQGIERTALYLLILWMYALVRVCLCGGVIVRVYECMNVRVDRGQP